MTHAGKVLVNGIGSGSSRMPVAISMTTACRLRRKGAPRSQLPVAAETSQKTDDARHLENPAQRIREAAVCPAIFPAATDAGPAPDAARSARWPVRGGWTNPAGGSACKRAGRAGSPAGDRRARRSTRITSRSVTGCSGKRDRRSANSSESLRGLSRRPPGGPPAGGPGSGPALVSVSSICSRCA